MINRPSYYIVKDRVPVPVTMMEWAMSFPVTNRDVAKTMIDSEEEVSTVFLGLDHQWGDGPPLLFETMIFGGQHDEYCWRWSTWEQAETGHNRIVEALMSGEDMDDVE